jgi:uncharacterized membrane protein YdcZ (DUF606 family)
MVWFALAATLLAGALLLDHYGLVGRERHPITLGRLLGAFVLLVGLVLFLSR